MNIGVTTESLTDFEQQLTQLLNSLSMENGSDTPDYMLAEYLRGCLENFNKTVMRREKWYGRTMLADSEIVLEEQGSCYDVEDEHSTPNI